MKELISVIMPAYNAEKTISEAIESALAQTYGCCEIIIIDDCSRDNTRKYIEKYAARDDRIRMFFNKENKGVAYTRTMGVAQAKGKWVAFLDSDDVWDKDKLRKQIEMQKKTQANLVFTGSGFIDFEGQPKKWILHVPPTISYRRLLKQNLISNSSVMMLKEMYQRYAVMDDRAHEDFACWLRYLRNNEKAVGIDEPLLIYRMSPASKSGNKIESAKMNWRTYRIVGLNYIQSMYYMIWYTINGLLKYKNLQ